MSLRDVLMIGVLVVLGGFIWWRDLAWMDAAPDAIPVLVGLSLFCWLGQPWRLQGRPRSLPPGWTVAGVVLAVLGVAVESTFLLALGWTALLWAGLSTRLPQEDRRRVARLLPLAALSFPWIILDGQVLG